MNTETKRRPLRFVVDQPAANQKAPEEFPPGPSFSHQPV